VTPAGNKTFFPNLNGLRFVAAATVVVAHIERMKLVDGHPSLWTENYIGFAGGLAVTFFFTLSGFLITWLLLEERAVTGSVSVKKFYIRRILRIWPLYYLIAMVGLFVMPQIRAFDMPWTPDVRAHLGLYGVFYLSLLPNVAFSFLHPLPYALQAWSIGVEEQFYLTWPWLMKWVRRPLAVLVFIFVAFVALHLALGAGLTHHAHLRHLLTQLEIDSMAIGGIGAVLFLHRTPWFLRVIENRSSFWLALVTAMAIFAAEPQGWRIHEPFSVLFGVIIFHLATSARPAFRLEGTLDRLGTVSYGIYMYHLIPIVAIMRLEIAAGLSPRGAVFHVALYVLTFAATMGLAFASYRWLESPLLRMKERFSVLHAQR
jgi:peptidoglycan/LPS O-acetylase OafA/YrhL